MNELLQGAPLEYSKLSMNFSGNSNKMLLLSFNPEMKRCLWVLNPNDTNLRLVSDDMRKLSAGSDINLIQQNTTQSQPCLKAFTANKTTRPGATILKKQTSRVNMNNGTKLRGFGRKPNPQASRQITASSTSPSLKAMVILKIGSRSNY